MADNVNKTAEDIIKETPGYDKSKFKNTPAVSESAENNDSNTSTTEKVIVYKNKEAENAATISLILGIVAVVGGVSGLIALVLGIIGVSQASKAKKLGMEGGVQLAGMIFSIVGLVMGAASLLTVLIGLAVSGLSFFAVFYALFAAIS